jgi:hypothetical protein
MAQGDRKLLVYTVIDRPGMERSIWVRVGTAFTNKDDSLNVYLDALPTNGRLNIREPREEPAQNG